MPEVDCELTSCEIVCYAQEIMRIADDIPQFNIVEILEMVLEIRTAQGRTENVDFTEEESEEEYEEEEEEEEEEEDLDYGVEGGMSFTPDLDFGSGSPKED